ncbi:MAG: hypothetical protein ABSB79_03375 [Syntrophales bacterium]
MFLNNPPLGLPAKKTWGGARPHHLIPLEKSMWPDTVMAKIVKIYQAYGLPEPMKQKLVEPYAKIFGGRIRDRESDLSDVNWDLAADYFAWEAASLFDGKEAERLQKKAKKKYGFIFSHYQVYENYTDRTI